MIQHPKVQYVHYYTDGTAARKLEYAVPYPKKASLPAPRKIKRKKIYIDPVAILGVCVAVCMLTVMAVGMHRLKLAQEETAVMQQYVEELRRENEALTQEYKESYDLREVERTALALGMVPASSVTQTPIQITVPEEVPEPGLMERISIFLTGLFA